MIVLTFDTDWMSEAALARFLREFPIPGTATFFCHQPFQCLAESGHELCPHPFITNLADWRDDLRKLTETVNPRARGTRTHSCVFSHMVGLGLYEMGFEYVSQANNLYQTGLRPFRHPWGVWELPIYYMDNMDFWTPVNWPGLDHRPFAPSWIAAAIDSDALHVFDFHPLHIALNTTSPADYQNVKPRIIERQQSPFDCAVAGRGARVYFEELCSAMADAAAASSTCADALEFWRAKQR